MSGYTASHYVLVCDRCDKALGLDGQYPTATEARAAAYGLGWRYPPRTTANGRRSTRTFDVCATCFVAAPDPGKECEVRQ